LVGTKQLVDPRLHRREEPGWARLTLVASDAGDAHPVWPGFVKLSPGFDGLSGQEEAEEDERKEGGRAAGQRAALQASAA